MTQDDLVLNKYRVQRRLAVGGMAEVFLAEFEGDHGFRRRAVIKCILPQFTDDPSFVSMFVDEALILSRLEHANIVRVLDFGQHRGQYVLVLEFVDGVDLRRLLKHGAKTGMTLPEVALIGEMVCRGLAHAQEAVDDGGARIEIVHRDLTPHNIMIDRSGGVKVMDFGIAKSTLRMSEATRSGLLKGKLSYMSPEQARGETLDHRSDEYSLGALLWECATGRKLFQADSDVLLIQKVALGEVQPPSAFRPDIPKRFEALLMKMLSARPDERVGDFRTLAGLWAPLRFVDAPEDATALLTDRVARYRADVDPSMVPVAPKAAATVRLPVVPPIPPGEDLVVSTPTTERASALTVWSATSLWSNRRGGFVIPVAMLTSIAVWGWLQWAPRVERASKPEAHRPSPATPVPGPADLEVTPRVLPDVIDPATTWVFVPTAFPSQARQQSPSVDARATFGPTGISRTPGPHRPAAGTETGTLSLRTKGPWVDVWLGQRRLGSTPLEGTEVPAGILQLRLINEGAGVDRELVVEVPPGEWVRRAVD